MKSLYVIACGGNLFAYVSKGNNPGYDKQRLVVREAASKLAGIIERDSNYVLTHGNGPQVGNVLNAYSQAGDDVHGLDIFDAVAQTQGVMGAILSSELRISLYSVNKKREVLSINTHVKVDGNDPAFSDPTKPIGPQYNLGQLKEIYCDDSLEEGDLIQVDDGSYYRKIGPDIYRRIVPSPRPKKIIGLESIINSLTAGSIPVAVGGGGIPVLDDFGTDPVDAVIDKDMASSLLAQNLNNHYTGFETTLLILTAVPNACLNFGTDEEEIIKTISHNQAKQYMNKGHFASGSMGPKVLAAMEAVQNGVSRAIITDLSDIERAVDGHYGTIIVPN